MERSMARYEINPLYIYIKGIFGEEKAKLLFSTYKVGTSAKWGGSTVYWQIDLANRIRTGKIMSYDSHTGKRVKEPHGYVSWVYSELKLAEFNLKQCLFGEHLLSIRPQASIIIVESEKTALIGSHFLPDYVWLATGGKNGCFNNDAMQVLENRNVILLPDLGATDSWKEKAIHLKSICKSVSVSNLLEEQATDEQRNSGLDIADFLLIEDTPQAILQKMIAINPYFQKLIDTFNLTLVEQT